MDIGKLDILESFGVYLMKKNDKVIYVGKAKNLKNRVFSYFNRVHERGGGQHRMVQGMFPVRRSLPEIRAGAERPSEIDAGSGT